MYERPIVKQIVKRLQEPRRFVQVVMGPRQVGKTTLLKQALAVAGIPFAYHSADAVAGRGLEWIGTVWESARAQLRAGGHESFTLVIDEIQKIRSWSEAVKKEWDADSFADVPLKAILCGSSRVLLERGLADSMAGRFEQIRVPHWSFPEMRDAFGWTTERFVWFGAYPGAAPLVDDPERWAQYIGGSIVDATINKDVLADAPVSKPALLRQTLELGSLYSGRELSLTKMVGSLQDAGNTTTLSGYLGLLDASGLLAGLHKCSNDAARRRASVPKMQVHNSALRNYAGGRTLAAAAADPEEWGRCVESAIGAHLLSQSFAKGFDVLYWRDGGLEVDYVLRLGERLAAIEVKTNAESSTDGLAEFRRRFHPVSSLVVGPSGMPLSEFLSVNPADLLR
jgi:predicted AAA+ superfamily ATPase